MSAASVPTMMQSMSVAATPASASARLAASAAGSPVATADGAERRSRMPGGGVIHAFSGSLHQAEAFWQLGFRLGIGGVISYERANKTREAIRAMPLEALLLETDAPDMPLQGRQGEINTPASLPTIARLLAQLRQQPLVDVISVLHESTLRLFPRPTTNLTDD